jgi:DNA replication protein DnaC
MEVETYEIGGRTFTGPDRCDLCDSLEAPPPPPTQPAPRHGYDHAAPEKIREAYRGILTSDAPRIGLVGGSGSGKTCALHCRLRLECHPLFRTSTAVKDVLVEAAKGEPEGLAARGRLRNVGVLAIDDLSQPTWTPGFAAAFFDLLESRFLACRKTYWTSQLPLAALCGKIAAGNGDPAQAQAICRRLQDNADIFTLP